MQLLGPVLMTTGCLVCAGSLIVFFSKRLTSAITNYVGHGEPLEPTVRSVAFESALVGIMMIIAGTVA